MTHRTYPSWPHAEPEQREPALSFLVLTRGQPDRIVTEGELPALLSGGGHIRLELCQPGASPLPLTLCCEPGKWTVCLPGEAGVSEPVVVAVVKTGSEGE